MFTALKQWFFALTFAFRVRRHADWRPLLALHAARHGPLPEAQRRRLGARVYRAALTHVLADQRVTSDELAMLREAETTFLVPPATVMALSRELGTQALDALARVVVADGVITTDERTRLSDLAAVLRIDDATLQEIVRRNAATVYQRQLQHALADRRLTPAEEASLDGLRQQLGLSHADVSPTGQQAQDLAYFRLLAAIESGQLPIVPPPMVLTNREVCHYHGPGAVVETKTVRVGTQRTGSGASIRIAKGVTVRSSSFRSQAIMRDVTTTYPGTLVITNKRVTFSATRKGFSIPFTQLAGVEPFRDGLGFQKGASHHVVRTHQAELAGLITAVAANR